MPDKGFDRKNWDATYAGGGQLNRYPADGVVSMVYRLMAGRDRAKTKILEIGCGAGNNAWFLAREGFDVTAVDGSALCLDYARARFASEGLTGTFLQKTFLELDQLSGPYDLILDRGALVCSQWEDLLAVMPHIARLMHPESYFLSFFFTADHPDKCHMSRCEHGATWFDPTAPVFGGSNWITLLDEEHLRTLFSPFTIVDLYKRTLEACMRKDEPYLGDSDWIVVCKK